MEKSVFLTQCLPFVMIKTRGADMYKKDDTPKRFDIENSIYDAKLLENVGTGKIHWHGSYHWVHPVCADNQRSSRSVLWYTEPLTAVRHEKSYL